jgi:5-methyltetrahydrofolate--homocysteine methyltransferase
MSIDFSPDRWQRIREVYAGWWSGELDRPVIPVELSGRDPGRAKPAAPLLTQATCNALDVPAQDLIDAIDYDLSTRVYLGDAFPRVNLDAFGPGVLAAMLGATLDNSSGRVWFHPPDDTPATELHFEYDPENVWLRRVEEICAAAAKRWQGRVLVGMTDLGGNLDILAAFRPGEKLLLELYDSPDEVKRLTWEAHEIWHRVYCQINDGMQAAQAGYTDWAGIYSEVPCYMLQCDFSYMISPQMFDEFAKPELEATCARLPRAFYHLDGPGQLPHLDSLLAIENLNGVQWVPGAGNPGCDRWPDVYAKIHAAGKKIQIIDGGFDTLDTVVRQLDSARGIQHLGICGPLDEEASIRLRLQQCGID